MFVIEHVKTVSRKLTHFFTNGKMSRYRKKTEENVKSPTDIISQADNTVFNLVSSQLDVIDTQSDQRAATDAVFEQHAIVDEVSNEPSVTDADTDQSTVVDTDSDRHASTDTASNQPVVLARS